MDLKTLLGKTLFFVAIVLSVAAFSVVFGQQNSLVGVVIVIVALMMLRKDLSDRPVYNIMVLSVMFSCMALGAHISLMDPFLGLCVNLVLVFCLVLVTTRDLFAPIHFPFLLGYAFMMSTPVPTQDLPLRVSALLVGAVLIVGLNVLIRSGRGGTVVPDKGRVDIRRMVASGLGNLRMHTMRSRFALRMSLLFAMWAFAWRYWNRENAVWLLYTTVALVQPYADDAWRKSAMRVIGTLVGSLLFCAVLLMTGGDVAMLGVALIILNYVYTVLDPERYDVMMVFITASALIVAAMSVPADQAVAERVAYILLGVLAATLANHLILPYHRRDENLELGRMYLVVNRNRISTLHTGSDGVQPGLGPDTISRRIRENLASDPDPMMERFVEVQDGVHAECSTLSQTIDPGDRSDDGPSMRLQDLDSRMEESVVLLGKAVVGSNP